LGNSDKNRITGSYNKPKPVARAKRCFKPRVVASYSRCQWMGAA